MSLLIGLFTLLFTTLSAATSVWGLIDGNSSFTILANLLEVDGLDGTLDDPSSIVTLLAPENSGFTNNSLGSGALLNHLIDGSFSSSQLTNGQQIRNTENSGSFLLAFTTPQLTFCSHSCSKVIRKDVQASNGYVHVLDKVIQPALNRTLLELIKVDIHDFGTLMHALITTHLQYTFFNPEAHITVFAPTTTAWNATFTPEQLQCLYKRIHQKDMITILLNHVLPTIVPSWQLKTGNVTSMAEIPIHIDVSTSGIVLNKNITVTKTDTFGVNGVIHTVNRVIVPHLESTCLY
jgi:uncharacterized surface protein with fasciclin (FAS1) repeats